MGRDSMSRSLPNEAPGCHRGESPRSVSSAEQAPLPFNARAQLEADQTEMRQMFGEMVRDFGGVPALTSTLGREETYEKKISGAINNEKDRKVQFEWLAAMLDDPAIVQFVEWINRRTSHEPPVRKRVVSQERTNESAARFLAAMGAAVVETAKREIAKDLGVRVEDVKL